MAAEMTPTLRGIRLPVGAQADFIQSGALFKRFQGGQGSGKTLAGVFEVRRYVKRHPWSIFFCTEPTYPMVRDILQVEFDRQLHESGEASSVVWRGSENKYVWSNGSQVWLRQCDQFERLRGPSVAAVWMDEAAQCPLQAYQILTARLRQPGYPHMFMFTGTPRGRNWLHWLFTPGPRPDGVPGYIGDAPGLEDEVESFQCSALDNPHLDPNTKESLRAAYASGSYAFRQEVGGETVIAEGLVYSEFDHDKHVCYPVDESGKQLRFVRVLGGIDWGWAEPGVAVVLGMDVQSNLWLLDAVYRERKAIEWWALQCKRLMKKWAVETWYCDPSRPEHIATLRTHDVPATKANNSVIAGINVLASRIASDQFFVSPKCTHFVTEVGSFSWRQHGGMYLTDQNPEDGNDHVMDATRYVVMAFSRKGSVTPHQKPAGA